MKNYCLFAALFLLAGPLAAQLSRFDFGIEKWSANSDAAGHIARFDPAHGNPAPSIYAIDSNTGLPWYFVAPSCFLGNQGHNYGDSLTFDFYINIYGSTPYTNDIILQGNGQTLVHNHAQDPATGIWNHLGARLNESDWHLGTGAGPNPTQAEFQQILANMTGLEIRGEYKTGVDTAWIDNIRLGHLPDTSLAGVICAGETFQFGQYKHTTPGIFWDELETVGGCDSLLVRVDLTVHPTFSQVFKRAFCAGESFALPDGSVTTAAGLFPFQYKTAAGCDSLVVFDLTALSPSDTLLYLRLPEGTTYVLPDGHAVRDTSLATIFYLKNSIGCDSTVRLRLDYIYYNVFIPNAFRPNDDGLNERFTLFTNADGREIRSLEIWNRWGELLFRRDHFPPNQLGGADGWDGNFRGELAPPGVYVWRAEVEFVDGRVLVFSGDLTLLR